MHRFLGVALAADLFVQLGQHGLEALQLGMFAECEFNALLGQLQFLPHGDHVVFQSIPVGGEFLDGGFQFIERGISHSDQKLWAGA